MLGNYFYYQRIRKAVAVFGSLFDELYVMRKNSGGDVISQVKVPLSYAPKRDFLERITNMEDGEEAERKLAVKLPRMSFEITSMSYDAGRQLPKVNACKTWTLPYDGTAKKLYTPVPYNIGFQLSIYAKSQDDALQVVEQILPYFAPEYTVTVRPLDGLDTTEDTPITFTGISFSDDYEAALESRRSIIYTLDFEMKLNLHKGLPKKPSGVITQYDIDLLSLDGDELFATISDTALRPNNNAGVVNEGDLIRESQFSVTNIRRNPKEMIIKEAPKNGTANVELKNVLTTRAGIIIGEGEWTYQSDADFNGTDSFTVGIEYEDGLSFDIPVTVTVVNIQDAVTDNVIAAYNEPTDIYVSDNDTFAGSGTYVIASGGEPKNGIATVTDASQGIIRYTPNPDYTGEDSFYYRFIPDDGQSEVGLVNLTISV